MMSSAEIFTEHAKHDGNCPKISNTLFHTILAQILLFMQLFLKILSGMAYSIDPDQTAPSGAVCSCHFVRHFGV